MGKLCSLICMATSFEGTLWIQISYRPGEKWALLSYSYPRHATWVSTLTIEPGYEIGIFSQSYLEFDSSLKYNFFIQYLDILFLND